MRKRIPRRILTAALSLAMLLTLLPATALADGDTGETTTSGIELSKTATLEDDGTYTIDLEAYATGTTTTTTTTSSVPLDIVLVIDQSGSMENSLSSTTYEAQNSTDYRYSSFSGQSTYYYYDGENYYKLSRGSYSSGSDRTTYYYVYYTDSNGTVHYLSGTGTTTDRPTDITSSSSTTTIYTGVLYTAETTTTTNLAALKTAVTNFVNVISANAAEYNVDHRIAIAGFASCDESSNRWLNTGLFINGSLVNYASGNTTTSSLTEDNYKAALVSVNDESGNLASSISTAINNFQASGATSISYGIAMANNVFEYNSNIETDDDGNTVERKRIVVVFTDGSPCTSGSSYQAAEAGRAVNNAYTTKNDYDATVYTIGLYESASTNVANFMNYLSSNYPSAQYSNNSFTGVSSASSDKYYMTTNDADGLNSIFQTISSDATSSSTTVTLDTNAVMKDIMADGFTLPDDFTVEKNVTIKTVAGSVNADTGEIEWGEETENEASASVSGNTVSVTGFDYAENYISSGHVGEKICVTITGVLPTEDVTTNEAVSTNSSLSGIYENKDAETAAAYFEQPQTIITKKLYVLDYAKTADLTGLDQSSITNIVKSYQKVSASDSTTLPLTYGTSALAASTLSYTPTTMQWSGYDSLYVFGQTTNETIKSYSANSNGNLWSKVSVIPANNVYYEDSFITDSTDGIVGIEYSNTGWSTDGSIGYQVETADSGTYGWETNLADDTTYSDGQAHASGTAGATATFTFTGTGVDIYSRTNMDSGKIYVRLTSSDGTVQAQSLFVDDLAVSGDYYQIPTASFSGLDYGTYTVTLTVMTSATSGTYTYYLDGIRVYNPLGDVDEEDGDAYEAYKADNELNAVFTEVRDMLIDAESFTSNYSGTGGVVFIDNNVYSGDGETENSTSVIGTYENLGPKNEVYLAAGQSIAFKVDTERYDNFYLGLKAPSGSTTATVTNGDDDTSDLTIGHSTDLYYEITPTEDGYIMVKNTGENLLSITKLRATAEIIEENDEDSDANGISLLSTADVEDILVYAASFDSLESVAYTETGVEEDSVTDTDVYTETGTDTDTETGDAYEDLDEDDVVIENPTEDTGEETEDNSQQSIFSSLFDTIRNWFNGRR